jgi:hypothetical protein
MLESCELHLQFSSSQRLAGYYSYRCNFIEIKANISEAQESMKEAHRKGPEIIHRYEMRSIKRKFWLITINLSWMKRRG